MTPAQEVAVVVLVGGALATAVASMPLRTVAFSPIFAPP